MKLLIKRNYMEYQNRSNPSERTYSIIFPRPINNLYLTEINIFLYVPFNLEENELIKFYFIYLFI